MPGLDFTDVVDPREDIIVTAPKKPKIKKLPKGSPEFEVEDDITVTAPKPKIKKMPRGMPDVGTRSTINPNIIKLPKGTFKKGGSVSSASKRADGIARKGKTRGKVC